MVPVCYENITVKQMVHCDYVQIEVTLRFVAYRNDVKYGQPRSFGL